MSRGRLVSIVVNNFNYAQFLPQAIESALGQTYKSIETIVVDDGSTDDSRAVIARYGDAISPLLKENGGQTSTFNYAFGACRGDVICYLDADDVLLPQAIERAMEQFATSDVVKVHWPLRVIDANGKWNGRIKPADGLPEGDLREFVVQEGPDSPAWPPTSGNAWSRRFLEQVLPIPETERALGIASASADAYLSMLAPFFGRVARLDEPQSLYRVHGRNDHSCMDFHPRLVRDIRLFLHRSEVLARYSAEAGFEAHPEEWKRKSWFFRIDRALREIDAALPAAAAFILIDGDQWMTGGVVCGRRRIPFLEKNGEYWGAPGDDDTAMRELDRLHRGGARFVVVAWPAFWWLDYYEQFHRQLRSHYRSLVETADVIVFEALS